MAGRVLTPHGRWQVLQGLAKPDVRLAALLVRFSTYDNYQDASDLINSVIVDLQKFLSLTHR